jgi:hypothetical protein
MKTILISLSIFLTGACIIGCSRSEDVRQLYQQGQEYIIVETLFDDIFTSNNKQGLYFVEAVVQQDSLHDFPSELLLRLQKKYQNERLYIKPKKDSFVSDTSIRKDFDWRLLDKQTKTPGTALSIGPIKWIDERTVEVKVCYWSGILSSSGLTYKLHRKYFLFLIPEEWIIDGTTMHWIS